MLRRRGPHPQGAAMHHRGMQDPLREIVATAGNRRALIDRGAGFWISWMQLDELAQQWARRLHDAGARPGQRVAVREPAGIRFAALVHACLRNELALVPIPVRAAPDDLERILADSRPSLLVSDGEVSGLPDPELGELGDASVCYTSGTSGSAKGVRLTLANHLASARGCLEQLQASERDRWLLTLAPHHIGGLAIFIRAALIGGSVVIVPRFVEDDVLQAIEEDGPTLLSVVPTMLERLLTAGGESRLRRLRAILVGGGPSSPDQVRSWTERGLKVCPTYGSTETCSQIAIMPPGSAAGAPAAAGRVGPHAHVDIVEGEIVVSGPTVCAGYVNPALASPIRSGRLHTGDLGELRDGLLYALGRLDDAINSGGEKIQPDEVETVLKAHPRVDDAAVAGVDDPLWGQRVGAWIVGKASVEELDAWCRERLPSFKIPRHWAVVDAIPRGEHGKVSRRSLGKPAPND